MTTKRDNAYFRERLKRMNRHDLLEKIDSGDIKMHRACVMAGLRKPNTKNRFEGFDRAWKRLSQRDKERFVLANAMELNAHLLKIREVGKSLKN